MVDFIDTVVSEKRSNNRSYDYEVYPEFIYSGKDIVKKGGELYAFWHEGKWYQDMDDLVKVIDASSYDKANEIKAKDDRAVVLVKSMDVYGSGLMKKFVDYCKTGQQSTIGFNQKILFSEDEMKREHYATTQLSYTPKDGPTDAFDEMFDVLYTEEELRKILWFIGAVLTNNIHKIHKFMYLYGSKGTGKGTAIQIFKMLFEGYYENIDLKALTSNSEFASSGVKEVPILVDEDAILTNIQNDTYLLKMTAHETVTVNQKHKQPYPITFKGLLITASNQPFQVRNIDSGITRRAVVVEPTGEKLPRDDYDRLMNQIGFELPAIAAKAINVFYKYGQGYYEEYVSQKMLDQTDHIFSFMKEVHSSLPDPVTLKQLSELYKLYLEDIGWDTKGYKRKIKIEAQRYFKSFDDSKMIDGERYRNLFSGFKTELLNNKILLPEKTDWMKQLELGLNPSEFDDVASTYPAQLTTREGLPLRKWDDVTTTLADINTTELHFVQIPINHIVIDFDLKNESGVKDLDKNLENASKFPPTYMELSKSGQGVHLHYIYDGDVTKLASLYEDDIEIKVFTGKQALRRKLTYCNSLDIAHITTGLPQKEEGVKVYNDVEVITWNEKKMRTAIKGNLELKYHDNTKPSIDFIKKIFEEARDKGIKYDLRDMKQDILVFASGSSNNAKYCLEVATNLPYTTMDNEEDAKVLQMNPVIVPNEDIVFFDIEVYSNLFIVSWKKYGEEKITTWVNPDSKKIEQLLRMPIVGFNNRRYDNHILYAALIGEDIPKLYQQSQRIISGEGRLGFYGGAYELSYADIYEYSSAKKSLKKWEVELGITHDEMEIPWDKPVPEDLWERVGEYCENDVRATEAVFNATYSDYTARLILSNLSGLKVNATTQQHAAAFLFGNDPKPQSKFVYTDLSEMFPGYSYSYGKSEYKGEDPSEGGYVYAEPGVHKDVALLDVASMHPNSLINLNYFGPYTERFEELVKARIDIKHGDYDAAKEKFNGQLEPYLEDKDTADTLSYAMKIIINIVYGLTSAKFENKFKHKDNADNIVAKRGALFMIDLKNAVQEKGYTVVHVKTDSIKIAEADQEIIDFVFKFGEDYGYTFEHEATYSRFALVNKAVYAAKVGWAEKEKHIGTWEVVGAQFAEPYVYKTLLTKEEVEDEDFAVVKEVKNAAIYLGDNFVGRLARVYASISGQEMTRRTDEKTGAVSGTKGYLWRGFDDYRGHTDVDMTYYDSLVTKAEEAINSVGDIDILFED